MVKNLEMEKHLKTNIKKERTRPIGISLAGGYLILQAIIAFSGFSDFGPLALLFAALFLSIGIGLLRLIKAALIAGYLAFSLIFLWGVFILLLFGGEFSLMVPGFVLIIIAGTFLFVLWKNRRAF